MNGLRKNLRLPRHDLLLIDLLTPAVSRNPRTLPASQRRYQSKSSSNVASISVDLLSLNTLQRKLNPFAQWPPPAILSSAVPSSQALDPALTDLTVVEHRADPVVEDKACWLPRDLPLEEGEEEWEEVSQSSDDAVNNPPQTVVEEKTPPPFEPVESHLVEKERTPSSLDPLEPPPVEPVSEKRRPRIQTDSPIRSILSRKPKPTSFFEWTGKETYSPPTELPESPLLNPYYLKTYAEKYPKKPPERFDQLSEREKSLALNPYAHMLASPVRFDAVHVTRLPSSFLMRTEIVQKPGKGEKDLYLVPSGIRSETPDREPFPARNVVFSHAVIRGVTDTKNIHKRLAPLTIRTKHVKLKWRSDMAEHILQQLRERTVEEILKGPLGMRSMLFGENLKQSDGKGVGCLLDFRPEEEATETTAVIGGTLVPVHNLRLLLGNGRAEELREKLKLREDTERVGVRNNTQTIALQIWLMRLRMYLRQWYTPWNTVQQS